MLSINRIDAPEVIDIHAGEIAIPGQELIELMGVILANGLPFRFRARGWSMTPFIRDRDVITVTSLGGKLPGTGEIVAFLRPGSENLVVHRVVAKRGSNLLIRGDNILRYSDGLVHPGNLLGLVTRIERNGKPLWLGLGPERYIIAWLSRAGVLVPLVGWLAAGLKRFFRK